MSQIQVCVMGAGGKMGTRTSNNLVKRPDLFQVTLVENSPKGVESIRQRGLEVTPEAVAVPAADIVVFAVPDTMIKKLSEIYVPMLKPGAGMIILDPAAAVAREIALRDDCTFGVAHPCHPSYFLDQDSYEAGRTASAELRGNRTLSFPRFRGTTRASGNDRGCAADVRPGDERIRDDERADRLPRTHAGRGAGGFLPLCHGGDSGKSGGEGIQREAAVSFMTATSIT
jgi:hypothetical protein